MTVPVQIPITSAVANGVTTVFPYQFKLARDTDLVVTVNGLVRVLGTDYTVSGVGNDAGGNVTLTAAPADGAKVVLRRVMAFKRDTNYTNLGDLLAATLNLDQDDPIMMLQQLASTALQLVDDGSGEFVWDAQGMRLINLGDGINNTDAVNLAQVLLLIEQVVNGDSSAGGSLSVTPKLWTITGDGTTTDFPLDGADVDDALFYDVALAGALQEPYVGYTIVGDSDDRVVRFAAAPSSGTAGWIVLRGYARPYSGTQPILTVSPAIKSVTGDATLDGSYQNTLILVTAAEDITLTIPENTGASTDWKAGGFFSVMQLGTGKVTVVVAGDGTTIPLPGFVAKTRDQHSVISATCVYADSDTWVITGDLLRQSSVTFKQAWTLPCSDEASTNLAVATDVYRFRAPFPMLLSDVRATVNVAQASGTVLTVDVKVNGTSIFTTKPTIDNAETSSSTSSAPYVLANPGNTVIGDGDLVSVDVTQVGAAGARGLKLQLIGQQTT